MASNTSMQRRNSTTPCPVSGPTQFKFRHRESLLSVCEDTAAIDFTTEFRASLRSVKPRRRQTSVRQARASVATFAIHEDAEVESGSATRQEPARRVVANGTGASTLLQPPQRLGRRVSFAPEQIQVVQEPVKSVEAMDFSLIDRRPTAPARRPSTQSSGEPVPAAKLEDEPRKILKPARRGTIYIPSDDTTMPSVYMGIFSPIKNLLDGNSDEGQPTMDLTGIAAQMAKKRGPRQSLAAAPPRRVPLQNSLRPVQESVDVQEILGSGGGKENLPPVFRALKGEKATELDPLFDLSWPNVSKRRSLTAGHARRKSVFVPSLNIVAASEKEPSSTEDQLKPELRPKNHPAARTKPVWNSGARPKSRDAAVPIHRVNSITIPPKQEPAIIPKKERVPSKFIIPKIPTEPLLQDRYPLLTEDISNPAMYEENWLAHQEVAITQLVNNLFSASCQSQDVEDEALRRIRVLELYQQPRFALLHTRLQASILYGALSVPAETLLVEATRLKSDVGMRARFVELWVGSYVPTALRVGLEVVVGRRCALSSTKALGDFITTFLVRNEDAPPATSASTGYQRTLLRSLMLVILLDQTPTLSPNSCLFNPTSSHKSSASFIKALLHILNPAVGDAIRALCQLDYTVSHVQTPLQEHEYHISNLAVDLRDGVKLTRLVELLLYPSSSRTLTHERDAEATTTVVMPDGETLALDLTTQGAEHPLSQHLKLPALGRATKLFNVQLALSALQGVKSMETAARDVRAEDIVDGYREKTVALLWGLTGRWGLGGLLDWADVRGEIRRLGRGVQSEDEEEDEDAWDDEEVVGFEMHKNLLRRWAGAVARRKGLEVSNLTTSFADGRVFGAIVDEYETFLPAFNTTPATNDSNGRPSAAKPLAERLAALGCSVQFAQLFASQHHGGGGLLFDRTTTLAALAFLCSRLLATSRAARAALVLQRVWRGRCGRVLECRKAVVRGLAGDCVRAVLERGQRGGGGGDGEHGEDRIGREGSCSDDGEGEADVWLSL